MDMDLIVYAKKSSEEELTKIENKYDKLGIKGIEKCFVGKYEFETRLTAEVAKKYVCEGKI